MTQTGLDVARQLALLLDRQGAIDTVTRMVTSVDLRDWSAVRACLSENIALDYSLLNGSPGTQMRADEVVELWRKLLSGFQATQHSLTNFLVTLNGDEATVECYFRAVHFLPNDQGDSTWTLGGQYRYTLQRGADGWVITGSVGIKAWATGNQNLFALAGQRVPAS